MAFDLKNYEDVQSRVKRWQEAYPMGRIVTEIVEFSAEKGHVLVKASCYRDDVTELPAGVDYAFGNVAFYPTHMKRFFIEDTSTSAIGRCISLVLPGEYPKPTQQDMMKVEKPKYETASSVVDNTDYWTVTAAESETLGTAVEQLQQQMGGEVLSESPLCAHGHMIRRDSKADAAKEWAGYFCSEKAKANQCPPIWMIRSATTGQWRLPNA
jgi:hypothetical protein